MEAWVALGRLMPLVWQPVIPRVEEHLVDLDLAIHYFLDCTAKWTPWWFNKPKFHIVLHLTEHIRKFGPAILFATEQFESFNAMIRSKSVHSNRHAPSRDIAMAFAQGNWIRHLMSAGFVRAPQALSQGAGDRPGRQERHSPSLSLPPSPTLAGTWRQIGDAPLSLITPGSIVRMYLGVDETPPRVLGMAALVGSQRLMYMQTQTGMFFPQARFEGAEGPHGFRACKAVTLMNGDLSALGAWVIYHPTTHPPGDRQGTEVGRVQEILRVSGSDDDRHLRPSAILIESWAVGPPMPPYYMPTLSPCLHPRHRLVTVQALVCTVNIQHNCARNECQSSGTRVVIQERERTAHTVPQVEHHGDLRDYVFNVCQMRDAIHIAHFRGPWPSLNREDIIHAGAAMEVAARTATRAPGARSTHMAQRARPMGAGPTLLR
ncbi:hypothetical protein JB92DRAFT_3133082 [Gautieria morchelliformis]|nr:hypothetical protein JB92DRAFT_3133082 [Gautieria morchelliformis]